MRSADALGRLGEARLLGDEEQGTQQLQVERRAERHE
jgi:hypothetical protein